jgi:FMN-dependent NADH-azoreductase
MNMTKLLYLKASPRKTKSQSIQLADAYLNALRSNNPDLEIDTIDLWEEDLPTFDGDKNAAKLQVIAGQQPNGSQRTAWDELVTIADRFIAADRYLIATPMWNSGIPYRLKHYIDLIHQPSLLWGLDPAKGYYGLLENKQATLALTSGVYAPGVAPAFGIDHQFTYLRDWLNQAGVVEIDELRFQPSMLTADPVGDFEVARARAARLAQQHGRLSSLSQPA